MRSTSIRISTAVLAVAMFSLVASGFAQGTYGPDGGWGRRGMGRGGGQMGRRGEGRLPSPEEVEGPPAPAVLRDLVELSPDQLHQYTARYDAHIADTKSVRDSLRATIQTMRSDFENGDRESARGHRPAAEQLWKELSPKDEAFSKGLKDLLDKKQMKELQSWEKEQAPTERWGRPPGERSGDDESASI